MVEEIKKSEDSEIQAAIKSLEQLKETEEKIKSSINPNVLQYIQEFQKQQNKLNNICKLHVNQAIPSAFSKLQENERKIKATMDPITLKYLEQVQEEKARIKNMCKFSTPSTFSPLQQAKKLITSNTNLQFSSELKELKAIQDSLSFLNKKSESSSNLFKNNISIPEHPNTRLLKTLIKDMENLVQIQQKTLISYQNALEESKRETNFNKKIILITLFLTLFQAFFNIPIYKIVIFILNFIFH